MTASFNSRRKFQGQLLALGATSLATLSAQAQAFPSKPVRLARGLLAGGTPAVPPRWTPPSPRPE